MILGTYLFTWFYGKHVGKDEFGNRYYESRRLTYNGRKKRWVLYKGKAEPSKIPASWHGWMHYMTDAIPSDKNERYGWEKTHLPNLTGTAFAYRPSGHLLEGGERAPATGDYEAWAPNKKAS